jgi:2,3-bisphosphoglycerate-independent phosphoglycerate mutase
MIHSLFFEELGYNPKDYGTTVAYREAVQLACDYLMDTVYMDFNEADVINHRDIVVDYRAGTVLVPCNKVYKPEYLH